MKQQNCARLIPAAVLLFVSIGLSASGEDDFGRIRKLQTTAERTGFESTSRYAEVMEFCKQLASISQRVELLEMGATVEGRTLPVLVIADPPVKSAEEARRSNKLVVFAMANIHAGEVGGKEALQMLARDLAGHEKSPLLDKLIILFAPIYNADGNERVGVDHRPDQNGPREVGQRANAQGLDLNRDHIKLESPEAQALARWLNEWSPSFSIDCHTTNGSYHQYAILYDAPRHPATHPSIVSFAREEFLPEIGRRMEQAVGLKSTFYGIFADEHKTWRTFEAEPRFSTHYFGLRNQIGILSEDYTYASFRDRVRGTQEFVRQCLVLAAERKETIERIRGEAEQSARTWNENDARPIGIRWTPAPRRERFTIAGFVERQQNGKTVATDQRHDYQVEYWGDVTPTTTIRRPWAYLLPTDSNSHLQAVIENLGRHGVEIEVLREDLELGVEVYRVNRLDRDPQAFQKHHVATLDVTREATRRRFAAGTMIVKTTQSLAPLIVTLLEPASQDGLATWNFFDDALVDTANSGSGAQARFFPVFRLPRQETLLTAPYVARDGNGR